MIPELKKASEHKMQKSLEALKADLAKVRTGRAHTGILDHVRAMGMVQARAVQLPSNRQEILIHGLTRLGLRRLGNGYRHGRRHDAQVVDMRQKR